MPFDLVVVTVSLCRFVMKYSELESRGDVKPELLFEETAKALLAEGIYLRKRGGPAVRLKAKLFFRLDDLILYLSIMFLL